MDMLLDHDVHGYLILMDMDINALWFETGICLRWQISQYPDGYGYWMIMYMDIGCWWTRIMDPNEHEYWILIDKDNIS